MKQFIKKILFSVLTASFFYSCDILRDKPFEVSAWSPGGGIHTEPDQIKISLKFSHKADRAGTERAFTLRENGEIVKGSFLWDDKNMIFLPASLIEKNKDYEISLTTEAKTEDGLSLEERFEGKWTTRSGMVRPELVSVIPADGAYINGWTEIKIRFSVPVDVLSCINEISISPAIKGTWHIEDGGLAAIWSPAEQWKTGRRYKLSISPFFESAGGKSTGKNYELHWPAGSDTEAPLLEKIEVVDKNNSSLFELLPDTPQNAVNSSTFIENPLWERDYKFRLRWNEAIDVSKLKSVLSFEPSFKFNIQPSFGFSEEVIVSLVDTPEWGSRFNLKLQEGISDAAGNVNNERLFYRLLANGNRSMPPKLIGIRIARSTGDYKVFNIDKLYEYINLDPACFPYETDKAANFELYFDVAGGAKINLFSLMDVLKVTVTNGCLTFSPQAFVVNNFSEPAPAAEFAGKERVEVKGILRNTANEGVVRFIAGKGLSDSYGNASSAEVKIQLLK
ncbi:MAG: hypothetical protein Pg6A_05800 [Termitinemataceae bacterium]|nr:MAG: hypothetical protein Pg6A_05800 [Termitinemataceae bacterium]